MAIEFQFRIPFTQDKKMSFDFTTFLAEIPFIISTLKDLDGSRKGIKQKAPTFA